MNQRVDGDTDLGALIADAAASATDEEDDDPHGPMGVRQPHGCDVLIADDAGASRELLAAILRNFGGQMTIREARNGHEAVAMWQTLRPRVTLLDIDMPGLDGLAVLQQLRSVDADTFVAIVSGGNSIDNVKQALALGAAGFVIKPYKPQRIVDLLKRYQDRTGYTLMK
jgi:two-component system, chemotaxis family, chemotaxis protein CheY